MIEASVAAVCTKGMNSNPDFHHNPIVTGNLRLFENCHHGACDRSVFCITNYSLLVALARTRIYRKNRSGVRAAGVTMQSQRITLAHRLKVAWAHDENFYFALSQTRWGQSCCPTTPACENIPLEAFMCTLSLLAERFAADADVVRPTEIAISV